MDPRAETMMEAVAEFGRSATAKLSNLSVAGEPEDQLRSPFEALLAAMAAVTGASRVRESSFGSTIDTAI